MVTVIKKVHHFFQLIIIKKLKNLYSLIVTIFLKFTLQLLKNKFFQALYSTYKKFVNWPTFNNIQHTYLMINASICQLFEYGPAVNLKDLNNRTALHYAVEQGELKDAQLLLKYGADPTIIDKNGDDPLQIACLLQLTEIFNYFVQIIGNYYSAERIANAYELIGAIVFFDDVANLSVCQHYWKKALKIRQEFMLYPKSRQILLLEPMDCYRYQKEFESDEELLRMMDLETLQIQSFLIVERILGPHHDFTITRLQYFGLCHVEFDQLQRAIDLFGRCLKLSIEKYTILDNKVYVVAQDLTDILVNYHIRLIKGDESTDDLNKLFQNVVITFRLLTSASVEAYLLLKILPQFNEQLENFDKILLCVSELTHLMFEITTLINNSKTDILVDQLVTQLLRKGLKSFITGNSLLHLYVRKLIITDVNNTDIDDVPETLEFSPKLNVLLQILDGCNANVNARNFNGTSPLHIALLPENYSPDIVQALLNYGAHLDIPDCKNVTPLDSLKNKNIISYKNLINLKCSCANVIIKNKITFAGHIPRTLESFVKLHDPLLLSDININKEELCS